MNRYHCLAGFLCLGMASALLAQQETQTTETKRRIDVPAPLGGITPQLTPSSETEPGMVFTGGVQANVLYEDNATALDGSRIGHLLYSIMPSIGLQNFGSRTQWLVNYSGGMTFDQRALQDGLFTQAATADLRHDFSRRLATEVRQEYLVTNNPFAQIGGSAFLPVLDGPGELSSFIVPTTATRTTSISMASISYQLGPHSGVGVNGNLSLQRFRDVITTTGNTGGLIDTRTIAGRAFYVKQISPRQTLGAEYQVQDLGFLGNLARTVEYKVFLFDEFALRQNMKLSLFGGPEHSHLHNALILNPNLSTSVVPGLQDHWSWAGGAMYTWQGKYLGLRASGRRDVSDGGGFLGAVRLTTGELELERRINARWRATLGGSYSTGKALGFSANGISTITSTEGHFSVEHRILRNLVLKGQYAHVYQPQGENFIPGVLGNHNRVEVGVEYQFQRTLSK